MDPISRRCDAPPPPFVPASDRTIRIGEIGNSELRALYGYWRDGGGDGRPLQRDQLDLHRIAPLLSQILLAEVVDGGRDFRMRIAGEEIESRYHGSLRGMLVSRIINALPATTTSHQWADVAADGRPRYRRGQMPYAADRFFHSERLMLPLCDQTGTISHILGAVFYFSAEECDPTVPVLDAIVTD